MENATDHQKNSEFVQFYRKHMAEVRWLINQNALSANILIFFMEHMDRRNGIAVSNETMQEYFEKSRASIQRAIRVLKENGFVEVVKLGNLNVYIINHAIAWTTWENNKKYAWVDANILISHTENLDYNPKNQQSKFKVLVDKLRTSDGKIIPLGRK